jgi:hypothetical protein
LFERKLSTGELRSAKSRERWAETEDGHLMPAFGDWYVDRIRRGDIEEWKAAQSGRVGKRKRSPHNTSTWHTYTEEEPNRSSCSRRSLAGTGHRRAWTGRSGRSLARAKIQKALTPRFMRRTFQDLGRAASVHDFVVRVISGHATTSMQEHDSSVSGDEVRTGLAKVIDPPETKKAQQQLGLVHLATWWVK